MTWIAILRRLVSCWKAVQTQSMSHDTDTSSPLHFAILFLDFFPLLILSVVRKLLVKGLAACIGYRWLPKWLSGGESPFNSGDPGSISGLGRSPGEGNGYPLQYSCLENSMDRGAWQATVHGVTKSWPIRSLNLCDVVLSV